ncbi:hypothetical protein DPMN_109266 [Dreissena polymorpha]|uniref:Uncharacterized protein n=1 Tax=Dreissena polymorpha TaxID=45954 RepID=A0A9D4K9Z8_DREPO|nr:hypothetical protein DPMN_109266 [Dreissena polymorpha]
MLWNLPRTTRPEKWKLRRRVSVLVLTQTVGPSIWFHVRDTRLSTFDIWLIVPDTRLSTFGIWLIVRDIRLSTFDIWLIVRNTRLSTFDIRFHVPDTNHLCFIFGSTSKIQIQTVYVRYLVPCP